MAGGCRILLTGLPGRGKTTVVADNRDRLQRCLAGRLRAACGRAPEGEAAG